MKKVDIEKQAIVKALDTAPNITVAAKELGASRRTLQARMRDHGIPPGQAGRPRQLLPKGRRLPTGVAVTTGLALGGALGVLVLVVWWARKRVAATVAGAPPVGLHGLDVMVSG